MKYVIVGALAGGTTTAARLRRLDEHAEIVVFERGEYIAGNGTQTVINASKIAQEKKQYIDKEAQVFAQLYNIDTRLQTEVTFIDTNRKVIKATHNTTHKNYEESYDKLILSLGTQPCLPELNGINLPGIYTVKSSNDIFYIKKDLRNKHVHRAIIIGSSFAALEMTEILNNRGIHVTVIEAHNQLLPTLDYPIAAIAQQHIRSKGVHLQLGTVVTEINNNNGALQAHTDNGLEFVADMVILAIDTIPDTALAQRSGLVTGKTKGIVVNEFLQTSNPDIYAVGPAVEFANPITGMPAYCNFEMIANKQGRICANNLVNGNNEIFKGAINVSVVKIFDFTIAAAGMPTSELEKASIPYSISTTHSFKNQVKSPLTIQLCFSPQNGQLLNAQIAGESGVEKRIEMLAAEIQKKGNIFELTEWEHNLTTPYHEEKDPINTAGYVAKNLQQGLLNVFYANDVDNLPHGSILIDVRSAQQFAAGSIINATNIPLENIRQFIDLLPKEQNMYLFCETGKKAYIAQRIFNQYGYQKVYALSGGLLSWQVTNKEKSELLSSLTFTENIV